MTRFNLTYPLCFVVDLKEILWIVFELCVFENLVISCRFRSLMYVFSYEIFFFFWGVDFSLFLFLIPAEKPIIKTSNTINSSNWQGDKRIHKHFCAFTFTTRSIRMKIIHFSIKVPEIYYTVCYLENLLHLRYTCTEFYWRFFMIFFFQNKFRFDRNQKRFCI